MVYSSIQHLRAAGAATLLLTASCIGQHSEADRGKPTQSAGQIEPSKEMLIALGNHNIRLCYIAPGTFTMGSNDRYVARGEVLKGVLYGWAETNCQDEGPEHEVTITRGYYLTCTKIWASLYCEFLNSVAEADTYIAINEFSFIRKDGDRYMPKAGCENLAANTVPWVGAVAFCEWASGQTESIIRLPTESEWEYAAAGADGRSFPWGESDEGDFNYYHRRDGSFGPFEIDPVGSHPANATPEGVMDMLGPIGEWCSDYYSSHYDKSHLVDPAGPNEPEPPLVSRVLRSRGRVTTDRARGPETAENLTGGTYGFRILLEAPHCSSESR